MIAQLSAPENKEISHGMLPNCPEILKADSPSSRRASVRDSLEKNSVLYLFTRGFDESMTLAARPAPFDELLVIV
ncbi:hypothetical protein AVEN_153416-1 [Araneus ventricosus]|uniref:Uncharacterized protein n=1 Tax=Araneus ventricosus TaxID=182803 RepID=A0A4Y2EBJ9_ARAVE|nr:hypothetical protein AVEN_153416-1 [Araneus ventricosus]